MGFFVLFFQRNLLILFLMLLVSMDLPRRKKSRSVLFEKALQLLFVAAQLFLATGTVQAPVRYRREALGIPTVGDLPSRQQNQGAAKQAIRIQTGNEHQRGEHHGKIPIVDTAGGTAPIFHKPRLERAEEQNADDIAHRVAKGDQDQNPSIKQARQVEGPNGGVQRQPHRRNERRDPRGLIDGSA